MSYGYNYATRIISTHVTIIYDMYIHICTNVCMYACIAIYACTDVCISHTCMCIHMHVNVYVCMSSV